MTREQMFEAEKILPLLNQAREHLDNARFRIGAVSKDDSMYQKCSIAYDYICKALDQF